MRTANDWIEHLQLLKHPEGGYFKEVYRAKELINQDALPARFNSNRNFSTSIYYLLEKNDFSAFHRIHSDETWHFYAGSPLRLYIIDAEGKLEMRYISNEIKPNHYLQYTVPFGCWFAAELDNSTDFTLLGCTVSPGFDFEDFQLAEKSQLIATYPQHRELIERLCRR